MQTPDRTKPMIFFTDIDGTLVDDAKQISAETLAALGEFLSRGNLLTVSTGRALPSALQLLEHLGIAGRENVWLSTYNGALIYDTFRRREILRRGIAPALVRRVFDAAQAFGIHIQTYSDTAVLAEEDNAQLQYYLKLQKLPGEIVPEIEAALEKEPCKILAVDFSNPANVLAFREEAIRQFGSELNIFRSNDFLLEFVAPGVDKGSALHCLCDQTGIPIAQTVSAGDAENDAPMIREAAVGCAMKNGEAPLRAHADYVTQADNNHSGVAEILKRFCL